MSRPLLGIYHRDNLKGSRVMARVLTFVRRIAGLLEPSLESEFYEEFAMLSRYLERLIVVSDMV
ncbi:MAG: hypothetical protein DRN54_01965, partial [Thaumarchaeota archaeon]